MALSYGFTAEGGPDKWAGKRGACHKWTGNNVPPVAVPLRVGGGLTGARTTLLPDNVTSELAGANDNVTFGVALSAKPLADVKVTVTSQSLSGEWGVGRFEGVPAVAQPGQAKAAKNSAAAGSGCAMWSYRSEVRDSSISSFGMDGWID